MVFHKFKFMMIHIVYWNAFYQISSLLENYKIMAQIEKAEHERKKYVTRRSHLYRQVSVGMC